MSILVLGLGNILLSDEGVGVRIVEALDASHDMADGVGAAECFDDELLRDDAGHSGECGDSSGGDQWRD